MNDDPVQPGKVDVWQLMERRTRDKGAKSWRPKGQSKRSGHKPSTLEKLFDDGFEDDDIAPEDIVQHTVQLNDWAVVTCNDGGAPEKAHLVPKSMLARGGAIYLRDTASWRQVLPLDKTGAVTGGAPFDVGALFDDPPPKVGDVVAVQRLGKSSRSSSADAADEAVQVTLIKGKESVALPQETDGFICFAKLDVEDDEDDDGDTTGTASPGGSGGSGASGGADGSGSTASKLADDEVDADLKQMIAEEDRRREVKQFIEELRAELAREDDKNHARKSSLAKRFKSYVETWAPSPDAGSGQPFDLAAWIAQAVHSSPFDVHADPNAQTPQTQAGGVSAEFSAVTQPMALAALAIQFARCCNTLANDNASSKDKRIAWMDLGIVVGKVGFSVCGIVSTCYALDAAVKGTTVAGGGAAAGTVGSAIGGVVGVVVCARLSRKAHRVGRRWEKIEGLREYAQCIAAPDAAEKTLIENLEFGAHKLRRTQLRNIFGATSAAIGAAGGIGGGIVVPILTAVGVAAAANFWNPVGWALTAVGIFAAVGITSYALYRHFSRRSRQKKRRKQMRPISSRAFALSITDQYLDRRIALGNGTAWRNVGDTVETFDIFGKKKYAAPRDFVDRIIQDPGFQLDRHAQYFKVEKVVARIEKKMK